MFSLEQFKKDYKVESINDLYIVRQNPLTILTNKGLLNVEEAFLQKPVSNKPVDYFFYNPYFRINDDNVLRSLMLFSSKVPGYIFNAKDVIKCILNDSSYLEDLDFKERVNLFKENKFVSLKESDFNIKSLINKESLDYISFRNEIIIAPDNIYTSDTYFNLSNLTKWNSVLFDLDSYSDSIISLLTVINEYIIKARKNLSKIFKINKSLIDDKGLHGDKLFSIKKIDEKHILVILVYSDFTSTKGVNFPNKFLMKFEREDILDEFIKYYEDGWDFHSIMLYFTMKEFKELYPNDKKYRVKAIEKNNGKKRIITIPHDFLLDRLKVINRVLINRYEQTSKTFYDKVRQVTYNELMEDVKNESPFNNVESIKRFWSRMNRVNIIDSSFAYRKGIGLKDLKEHIQEIHEAKPFSRVLMKALGKKVFFGYYGKKVRKTNQDYLPLFIKGEENLKYLKERIGFSTFQVDPIESIFRKGQMEQFSDTLSEVKHRNFNNSKINVNATKLLNNTPMSLMHSVMEDKSIGIDFKDFFPSIRKKDIIRLNSFLFKNVPEEELNVIMENFLDDNGRMYIGNPLSPVLSNFIMLSPWKDIQMELLKKNIISMRYSDDTFFLSQHLFEENNYFNTNHIYNVIESVLKKYKLNIKINKEKTRISKGTNKTFVGLAFGESTISFLNRYSSSFSLKDLAKEITDDNELVVNESLNFILGKNNKDELKALIYKLVKDEENKVKYTNTEEMAIIGKLKWFYSLSPIQTYKISKSYMDKYGKIRLLHYITDMKLNNTLELKVYEETFREGF